MERVMHDRFLAEWKAATALYAELSAAFVTGNLHKDDGQRAGRTDALEQIANRLRLELERFKTHGCARETKAIIFRTT